MIISRKRFNEKVREAVEFHEQQYYQQERLREMEREFNRRFETLERHCWEMERKIMIHIGESDDGRKGE